MILYLDMMSGISGDMCLGALVDLGVDPGWIEAQLAPLFNGFSLRAETVFRQHLRAVSLHVDVSDDKTHRHYTHICGLIQDSGLSGFVKEKSLAAFERIARAESRIHGKDLDTVHFHEVGGIDSMVDIIGSFLCVEKLGITGVHASQVPLGSGFVDCAHGKIPVPVPATLAILEGVPVKGSDARTEIVTPTGAALAVTLAETFGPMPDMEIAGIGYGAGKRDTGSALPNLLRMVMGKAAGAGTESSHIQKDQVCAITTNLDDMSPEVLGFVMELALAGGALDVSFLPVHMKKNRPGTRVEILCRPGDRDRMIRLILAQTTALGVRYQTWDRAVLRREPARADTGFGRIRVKKVWDPDGRERLVPEYEVLKKLAGEKNLPLKDVYARVMADLAHLSPCQDPLDTEKARL